MKNVLLLNFSIRKYGNSWIASDVFSKKVANDDIQVETISIPSLKLKHCTGCFGCNNGELKCVMKDDLEGLKEKLTAADAIVLVSPCFVFSAPASMKTIIDRMAAWALNEIETGGKRRLGISISVAGATGEWYSMQRGIPSLFLKLMNCDVAFMKTYERVALKGDILLKPFVLQEIEKVAEAVKATLLEQSATFPLSNEDKRLTYCPNCGNDAFRVYERKTMVCSVCGKAQRSGVFGIHPVDSLDKTSPTGAKEHSVMIGGNIENSFASSEEIARRMDVYLTTGSFDCTEYIPKADTDMYVKVEWSSEGLEEFNRVVPKAFQSFVKKAVEKKAAGRGETIITKEVFLEIKKASGN